MPMYTIDGSDGAMAMSPTLELGRRSVTGVQVMPPLTVLKTPPAAVPTYMIRGSDSTTAISSMRPPGFAGPMFRNGTADSASFKAGFCAPTVAAHRQNKSVFITSLQTEPAAHLRLTIVPWWRSPCHQLRRETFRGSRGRVTWILLGPQDCREGLNPIPQITEPQILVVGMLIIVEVREGDPYHRHL